MPWPVLLLSILILLIALIAVLMHLKMTAHVHLLLSNQFSVQLHIKLYRIPIKTFEFPDPHRKKSSPKKSGNKGRLPNLKFIRTSVICYGTVGLMDAKDTALAVGGLYSLFGALSGAVGYFTSLKKYRVQVTPVYNRNQLHIEANGIAEAKVGHIILAYIRYLVSKRKGD